MKNYSSEQVTRVISALFLIFAFFGIKPEVSEGQLVSSINTLVVAGGVIVAFGVDVFGYFKRWSKGDVNILGKRV